MLKTLYQYIRKTSLILIPCLIPTSIKSSEMESKEQSHFAKKIEFDMKSFKLNAKETDPCFPFL